MAYLHVKATVEDYDEWYSAFENNHSDRAEHGGQSYQLFQTTDDPNEVVVLIEFDGEESARGWVEYLEEDEDLDDASMSGVEISYLNLIEHEQL